MTKPYDIIALGESLLRFTPPHLQRLGQNTGFDVHVGGCESNTVSAMARLGLNCAWLSRLPDNELGTLVSQFLAQHGVAVKHVIRGSEDRMGLYFYEPGKPPYRSQVIYDRADSAMARIQPTDLPTELFHADKARLFHTSGITLALSDSARATVDRALQLAQEGGMLTSLDINYRHKLWSPSEARQYLAPLLLQLDVVLVAERDIKTLWPDLYQDSAETTLRCVRSLTRPGASIVMTRGKKGACVLTPEDVFESAGAFEAAEVERLGGGDAFSAGFLTAWLEGQSYRKALTWGAAVAAFKYATPGDIAWIDRPQVEALLSAPTDNAMLR